MRFEPQSLLSLSGVFFITRINPLTLLMNEWILKRERKNELELEEEEGNFDYFTREK